MTTLPALFVAHGSPMNAIQDNDFTRALAAWGRTLRAQHKPRAILCISAHWQSLGTCVATTERPRTIYDFSGFPPELSRVSYPCPGAPSLATQVQSLLPAGIVTADPSYGLDHGAWSVLRVLYPDAEIPVVQLSLDRSLRPRGHWELAAQLRPLRDDGILVLGSGNIVHSFAGFLADDAAENENSPPLLWAKEFDDFVAQACRTGDYDALIDYRKSSQDAPKSVPTPEHYLPLLYAMSIRDAGEPVSFPTVGFQFRTLSMRSVQVG